MIDNLKEKYSFYYRSMTNLRYQQKPKILRKYILIPINLI